MKYSKIKGYLKVLGNVSILKTLYINLRLFPFFQAIKLPIVIGKGTIIRRIGKVILNCPARPALLTMGVLYLFNDKKSNQGIWDNAGTIVISGKVTLHTGLCLYTKSNGKISFGGVNQIGMNNIICSEKLIEIGKFSQTSWYTQIMDTDFHYMENVGTGAIYKKSEPVFIGDNVWIGNHVAISKGTVIPNGCIVAAYSLVNKPFQAPNMILAGMPAKEKKSGLKRIFSEDREKELDQLFNSCIHE